MSRISIWLAVLATLSSGCMIGPTNHQAVCGANAPISFSGYLPLASHTVFLRYSNSSDGPWQTFATVSSSATGYSYQGATYYPYSVTAQIPEWLSDGSTMRAYVRAEINTPYGIVKLTTFDTPIGGQPTPLACIFSEVSQGETMNGALASCASSNSPVVELTAPALSTCACNHSTHTGDLIIDDAIVAADYVCLQTLDGSLTITEDAPEVVSLASLTSITGDITFDYSVPSVSGPLTYRRRTIDLSALTTIGGNATLTATRTEGPKSVPQGMHSVTSIGGDISIDVYDANPGVFGGLVAHNGNILIEGPLDINAGASFTSLTSVNGDIVVRNFYATNGILDSLQTLNGNLQLESLRLYPSQSFQSLTSVSGDLEFIAMKQLGPPWPLLSSVGGELSIRDHATLTNLDAFPVSATVGSLRIENNAALSDIGGVSFQVASGPIVISGNSSLSQCEVTSFLAAQSAGGWAGSASVSGTIACP